jgi:aspartate 1-decarboxylase
MHLHLLKSKIHRARVTTANLNYEGSLSIPLDLMDKVGMVPYERVLCGNMANGERFETYAIAGEAGSRQIVLNGAVARLGTSGDILTIMAFAVVDADQTATWRPKVLVLDKDNRVEVERGT